MKKRPFVSKIGIAASLIWILVPIYCFTSCGPKILDREEVINEYGPEVINYFYETAFHTDMGGGIRDEAFRWKDDIRISLHGEMLKNDSAFVKEALLEINSLDLPISMSLVSDPENSNIKAFFGDPETLAKMLMVDSVTTVGVAITGDKSGAIEWTKIGILNNARIYSQTDSASASLLRKKTILEEITQSLGIVGDSYTYYSSYFFEGANEGGNEVEGLSAIDRKVVEFLYDGRVFPEKILRTSFEEKYADLLYDRIDPEKLSSLLHEYGMDRHGLDSLQEMAFRPETGERFVKFPRTVFLKLSGDSTIADVKFCTALIARFNAITPWFQLELVGSNKIWNGCPTITIHYEEADKYKGVTYSQVRVKTSEMMFTYQLCGDIWMKFHNPKKELIPYHRAVSFHHELLTRALFKALGLSTREKILVNATTDSLEIDKKYENYFRLLYDPRFPSDITKAEFGKLLESII